MVVIFFFFKQKTAYEMRISDWSSDVCSSDLHEKVVRLITDRSGRVVGVETARIPETRRADHRRLYGKVVPMLPFKAVISERAGAEARTLEAAEIGRTSCRERVCQYV